MGKEKNPKKQAVTNWFSFDLGLSIIACLCNTVTTSFVDDSVLRSIITYSCMLGFICVILTICCRRLYIVGRENNKLVKIITIVLRTILIASIAVCILYIVLCNDLYRDKLLNH